MCCSIILKDNHHSPKFCLCFYSFGRLISSSLSLRLLSLFWTLPNCLLKTFCGILYFSYWTFHLSYLCWFFMVSFSILFVHSFLNFIHCGSLLKDWFVPALELQPTSTCILGQSSKDLRQGTLLSFWVISLQGTMLLASWTPPLVAVWCLHWEQVWDLWVRLLVCLVGVTQCLLQVLNCSEDKSRHIEKLLRVLGKLAFVP